MSCCQRAASDKMFTADSTCLSAEEEERWRRWVDDRFVRVLTINIYRNGRESFQTFDYIAEHGNFSWPERQGARVIGAAMMWALSGGDIDAAIGAGLWLFVSYDTTSSWANRRCSLRAACTSCFEGGRTGSMYEIYRSCFIPSR